ncbi:MAG: cytidylate kinase-like family protein [Lachnospiraceae bacterium]|nr:cytidylate kinase-like family protein [Lachnospiraceae bacterium]
MNTVITIGREFGSGGRELGRRLAEALGYEYYDNEVLTEMVKHTEMSENYIREIVEGKSHRLFPITVEHTFIAGSDYTIQQVQNIYRAQTEVIKEMALKSDCVIVGRCADFILREEEQVRLFRLFIYADIESRIKRCMERAPEGENMDEKQMRKYIQKVDKGRAGYYEDYTLQKWGDKSNYDMCFNTTNVSIEEIVDHIASLFR